GSRSPPAMRSTLARSSAARSRARSRSSSNSARASLARPAALSSICERARPDMRVASYRVQLCPSFGFAELAELAPYLAALGVSHVYLSPYLQAASGSTHGYDIVDPSHVNRELGGEAAHTLMIERLRACGLGQVIDV